MKTLITCCATAGIGEWICCPGAQNAPLIACLSTSPTIHLWTQADERSAGYFALGRIQATARPVAILAGGGTTLASLAPAVVEAFYQRRPLLIVSIESPCASGGAGIPGSIEQEGLFGSYANSLELSLPCGVSDLPDLRSILAEGQPVHLRLSCSGSSANTSLAELELADAPPQPPFRGSLVELSQMLRFRSFEGLVMLIGGLEPHEQEPAIWLAETLRVPLWADAASGLREVLSAQRLQSAEQILTQRPPRFILRVGDVPTTPFWAQLENMPEVEVFSITRTGFSGLHRRSTVVEGDLEQIMKALGDVPNVGDTERLMQFSRKASSRIEEAILSYPESEAAMTRYLSNHVCLADVLSLGSPSTTQLWNNYAQCHYPSPYMRAGSCTGGADGTVASFLGNSSDASYACCFTGDLAALRDASAANLLAQLPPGKRIIAILNNEGAGFAQSNETTNPELQQLLTQAPHLTLADLARLWQAEYYSMRCEADFELLDTLDDQAFVLLDIQSDPEQTQAFRQSTN